MKSLASLEKYAIVDIESWQAKIDLYILSIYLIYTGDEICRIFIDSPSVSRNIPLFDSCKDLS